MPETYWNSEEQGAEAAEFGRGEAHLAGLVFVGFGELDDAVGLREWKRAEENAVDDGEDGGVGSDAESEGEHGGCGEAGRLRQDAEAEADVLPQGSHKGFHGIPPEKERTRGGISFIVDFTKPMDVRILVDFRFSFDFRRPSEADRSCGLGAQQCCARTDARLSC